MPGSERETALAALRRASERERPRDMARAFAEDPDRAVRFSATLEDLTLDYSKCAVNEAILGALLHLAEAVDIAGQREAMFRGERINRTEDRAALHVALRAPQSDVAPPYGRGIAADVAVMLDKALEFAEAVRTGRVRGAGFERFRNVVNIGIGGSDLGPAMATMALAHVADGPKLHFVSNIDGADLGATLAGLDPATTLFIIASKTFTTVETMTNAATAHRWLADRLGEAAVASHFVAVSTATERVAEFGIAPERMFEFRDWVGGRYSIWSAIGLPLMIAIGAERFRQFLAGGHAMDAHFRAAPARQNLPLLLGLIGYHHRAVLGFHSRAILPYDQRLARFPAYIQQLDMESNGKGVTIEGEALSGPSGPIVWGEPGTNGQHAFFQLLHQGTDIVPVEFLLAAEGETPALDHHHRLLIANCLAQSEAMMLGRSRRQAEQLMLAEGMDPARAAMLAPHCAFPGNRPSITLLYRRLDPGTLGRLVALYEHRVFVEAVLYGVNPFDQWGVELGKELATRLLPALEQGGDSTAHDGSTRALVARILALRGG